ncbi:hypothetical protein K8R42_02950 [bacterium]|nr:hypothetical protein [bacterium]
MFKEQTPFVLEIGQAIVVPKGAAACFHRSRHRSDFPDTPLVARLEETMHGSNEFIFAEFKGGGGLIMFVEPTTKDGDTIIPIFRDSKSACARNPVAAATILAARLDEDQPRGRDMVVS